MMGKIFWAITIFLVIGGYMIYSSSGIDVSKTDGKKEFAARFGKWVWHVGGNVKDVTAYAIKKEWLPEEKDNNTSADRGDNDGG